MADIVIFGTGMMAQVVGVYLRAHSEDRIVGYTVDAAWRSADTHEGLPVVDWETLEQHFPPDQVLLFGPFSSLRMNTLRRDRYLEGRARGYRFTRFIHPASHVYTDDIGENCLILEACVIQPFVRIGNNVIVWSMSNIGHHAQIGDHCFLSGLVAVAGHTVLGPECYLSAQVGVGDRRRIGAGCALLNGVFVARDLPDHSVAVGPRAEIKGVPSTRLHRLL